MPSRARLSQACAGWQRYDAARAGARRILSIDDGSGDPVRCRCLHLPEGQDVLQGSNLGSPSRCRTAAQFVSVFRRQGLSRAARRLGGEDCRCRPFARRASSPVARKEGRMMHPRPFQAAAPARRLRASGLQLLLKKPMSARAAASPISVLRPAREIMAGHRKHCDSTRITSRFSIDRGATMSTLEIDARSPNKSATAAAIRCSSPSSSCIRGGDDADWQSRDSFAPPFRRGRCPPSSSG